MESPAKLLSEIEQLRCELKSEFQNSALLKESSQKLKQVSVCMRACMHVRTCTCTFIHSSFLLSSPFLFLFLLSFFFSLLSLSPSPPLSFSPSFLLPLFPSPPLSSPSLLQDLLVKESVVERLESKNKELSTERDRVESDLLMAQDELEKQNKMASDLERANTDLKSRIERGREGNNHA